MKKFNLTKKTYYISFLILLTIIFHINILVVYKIDRPTYNNYKVNVDVICQKARPFNKDSIFYNNLIHLKINNFLTCKTNNENEIATLEYIFSTKINEKVDFNKIKLIIKENFKHQINNAIAIEAKENLINNINNWYRSDFQNVKLKERILEMVENNFLQAPILAIKNVDEIIINIDFSKINEIENIYIKTTILVSTYFLLILAFITYLILFFFYYGRSLHQE